MADRKWFRAQLEKALREGRDFCCLGCLLADRTELRGGHREGGRSFPGDNYYVTGTKGAHDYTPRSWPWLQRVLRESIKALDSSPTKDPAR